MEEVFNKKLSGKLSQAVKDIYSFEWPELKNWLEQVLTLIIESNSKGNISNANMLNLSKVLLTCFSPAIPDPLHSLAINLFTHICSFRSQNSITLLCYCVFPHAKFFTASNTGNFSNMISTFSKSEYNNLRLRNSLLCSVLNGLTEHGERNGILKKYITQRLEDLPILTEDILWIYILKTESNHISIFKILKNIKGFNSNVVLVVRGYKAAMESGENRVRQAAIDAICEKYGFDKQTNELNSLKVFFLTEMFKYIQENSISMRFYRMLPDDLNDNINKIAVKALLNNIPESCILNAKMVAIVCETGRFERPFLDKIVVPVIMNMSKFKENITDEHFEMFKKLFGNEKYQILWDGLCREAKYYLNCEQDGFFASIILALDIFNGAPRMQNVLLNYLHDNISDITMNAGFFKVVLGLTVASNTFANNCHLVFNCFALFNPISEHKSEVYSFAEYYYCIKEKRTNMRIAFSITPEDYSLYPEDFLFCYELLIMYKQPLSKRSFNTIWKFFNHSNQSKICTLILNSAYSLKALESSITKIFNSPNSLKNLIRFYEYSQKNLFLLLKSSKMTRHVLLCVYDNQNSDIDIQFYSNLLTKVILESPSLALDEFLFYLTKDLANPGKSLLFYETAIDYINCITFIISQKSIGLLENDLSQDLEDSIKKLSLFKIQCKTYYDLIIVMASQFIVHYNSDVSELREISCQLLCQIVESSQAEGTLKILDIFYIILQKYHSDRDTQKYILRCLQSSCQTSKLVTFNDQDLIKILKSDCLGYYLHLIENTGEPSLITKAIYISKNLSELYTKFNLQEAVQHKIISMCLKFIIEYQDFTSLNLLKEYLYATMSKDTKCDWLPEALFGTSNLLYKVMYMSYKTHLTDTSIIIDLKDILSYLSMEKSEIMVSGIMNLWVEFMTKDRNKEKIKTIKDFMAFFEFKTELIMKNIGDNLGNRKMLIFNAEPEDLHMTRILCMLEFFITHIEINEIDFRIVKESIPPLEKILQFMMNPNYPELILAQVNIFVYILKWSKIDKLKEKLKETYIKSIREFLKFSLSCDRNILDYEHDYDQISPKKKVNEIVAGALSLKGYILIKSFFQLQKDRHEFVCSLLKYFLELIPKANASGHTVLNMFHSWISGDEFLSSKVYSLLISLSTTNGMFLRLFDKFPDMCFAWGRLMNLCESHTKLFEDFRKPFLPSSNKADEKIQEKARLMYITAFLVFTGNVGDYINPEVISKIVREIEDLIENDIFFPISVLMLITLSARFTIEDFSSVFLKYKGTFFYKLQEIRSSRDVGLHTSVLKLIDILLARDFSHILSLMPPQKEYFTKAHKSKRKGSVLLNINPSSIFEVQRHEKALVAQFNEFHSEQDAVDMTSIDQSIEEEFKRIKDLIK